MQGELDFEASLRTRVPLFRSVPVQALWAQVKTKITFKKGVEEFCAFCKERGIKMAICSSGFLPIIRHVQGLLQIDEAFGNQVGYFLLPTPPRSTR